MNNQTFTSVSNTLLEKDFLVKNSYTSTVCGNTLYYRLYAVNDRSDTTVISNPLCFDVKVPGTFPDSASCKVITTSLDFTASTTLNDSNMVSKGDPIVMIAVSIAGSL